MQPRVYRYRLKPSKKQAERLVVLGQTGRRFWNALHVQFHGKEPGPEVYSRFVKATSPERHPAAAQLPAVVANGVIADYGRAIKTWQSTLQNKGRRWAEKNNRRPPQLKPSGRMVLSWQWQSGAASLINTAGMAVPGWGKERLPVVQHRPFPDDAEITAVRITRDALGYWYAAVSLQTCIPAGVAPTPGLVIGIDLGVTEPMVAATAEGRVVNLVDASTLSVKIDQVDRAVDYQQSRRDRARHLCPEHEKHRKYGCQACVDTRSRRFLRRADIVRRTQYYRQNLVRDAARKVAAKLRTIGPEVVGLEALRVVNMTKRAKGKGAAAKAGLNRKILSRGFGMVAREIETALGTAVYSVSAAYTSQTCSRCGVVDAKQRQGKIYRCACGYVGDADVNAATNIARRAAVVAKQAEERAAARAAAKGKAMPDRGRPRRRVAGTMTGGGLTPPDSGATALVASGEVLP